MRSRPSFAQLEFPFVARHPGKGAVGETAERSSPSQPGEYSEGHPCRCYFERATFWIPILPATERGRVHWEVAWWASYRSMARQADRGWNRVGADPSTLKKDAGADADAAMTFSAARVILPPQLALLQSDSHTAWPSPPNAHQESQSQTEASPFLSHTIVPNPAHAISGCIGTLASILPLAAY